MPNKLIVANWKSNPSTSAEAIRLAKESAKGAPKNVEVVLCAPFVFLESLSALLTAKSSKLKAHLGSQDLFSEPDGPYTGEVSWEQLKKLKVSYAIVGHSERRRLLHETDDMINKKVLAALDAGIAPILCVAEPHEVRKEGMSSARNYVLGQLNRDLEGMHKLGAKAWRVIVTYEPSRAISTSRGGKEDNAESPKIAVAMIEFIKEVLYARGMKNSRVLYGGSVNPKNAESFLREENIDGVLVGGASLKPAEFRAILKIASQF